MLPEAVTSGGRRKIIGIVGGLGPYAHVNLELQLLLAARELAGAMDDQDYPEWILSSVPQTPDRTQGILDSHGPDPLPWLERSIRRLEPRHPTDGDAIAGADFVIVACNTAHYHLDRLRRLTLLPLWNMVEICADHVAGLVPDGSRVGLLATEGTLVSELYHRPLRRRGLVPVSLLDADDGGRRQRQWITEPIYGDGKTGEPGLKAEGASASARRKLERGADYLVQELGCGALIAACTEISLAFSAPHGDAFEAQSHGLATQAQGVPWVDPVRTVCRRAIRYAYGLGAPAGVDRQRIEPEGTDSSPNDSRPVDLGPN